MKIKNKISPFIELSRGLASHLPGFDAPIFTRTGGTNSARYCYSVWMRHLVMAKGNGVLTGVPKIVAELGPGDSLGIGLCALLSSAEKYFAFDVVKYANPEKNLKIFEDLIELFRKKTPIPDDNEFPRVKPKLDSYSFPNEILLDDFLKEYLDEKRLDKIRKSIKNPASVDSMITYQVPWNDSSIVRDSSVGMIFSQATLEHIDEIENAYATMHKWLKPGGFMSHQIDLKCHGTSSEWNGHWTYSDRWWKIIRGKRQWLLNRLTYSKHVTMLKKYGFVLVLSIPTKTETMIDKKQLSEKFRGMLDEDLVTSELFFVAKK